MSEAINAELLAVAQNVGLVLIREGHAGGENSDCALCRCATALAGVVAKATAREAADLAERQGQ